MELLLERKWKKDTYTIGNFYVNGNLFCNTMEDKDRGLSQKMNVAEIAKIKIKHETAIPTGEYNVIMTYSNRFGKYLPELQNVKCFEGVRIHSGNTASDSSGCILLGKNTVKGKVTNSRETCNTFFDMMNKAIQRGEKITLIIK